MKKMNKTYEAPVAEMIEMQMPVVLMVSAGTGTGINDPIGGNSGLGDD
jgi:hypothetical protein